MRRDGVRAAAQHPRQHRGCCDFTASPPFGGSRADETTPEGCTNVALYEIRDPKLSSFIRQADPMATGPQAKEAIARRSVSHRKMMTMRLPYLRRNRACVRHGGIDCSCCARRRLNNRVIGWRLFAVVIGVAAVVCGRAGCGG
jgi:hypothetical protein